MPESAMPVLYSAGDILVAPIAGGNFQVARVSANGRSTYVLGVQRSEPAALLMAARATSGGQRVFLSPGPGSEDYRAVESGDPRG